ncbi:MAG: ROK family protein [Eubacterium sp.]|nr:ROK family protein [Candidatus Colimonas fimequi]
MINNKPKSPIFGDIYRYIYNKGYTTRKSIAADLGLSFPTVTNNLQELIETGYVIIDGTLESTGGRKAYTYKCAPTSMFAVGLDITKHHLNVVLVNTLGELVDDDRFRINFEDTDAYYQFAAEQIDTLLASNDIAHDKILGVGISLPILLKDDQKTVTYAKVVTVDDTTYDRIGKFIHFPYLLFNDANSAGLAEWWNLSSEKTAVYIALNPSIGGATIDGKLLHTGDNNRASEFGHITIIPGGRRCYCGKKGCVDAYCSETVLSGFTDGNIQQFFQDLPYNVGYQNTFDDYLDHLALAANTLRVCYDCDIIVGGNVGANMGEEYIEVLKNKLIELNPFEDNAEYIRRCQYITSASAVGASLYYIKQFIENM